MESPDEMTKGGDVVLSMLGECTDVEVNEYYTLAVAAIVSKDDRMIDRYRDTLTNLKNMPRPMKKVIFFLSLNVEKWMKAFVTREDHDYRVRPPMSTKEHPRFFADLAAICEDYMNCVIDEEKMIQHTRLAYERRYDRTILYPPIEGEKKRKRRRTLTTISPELG